MKNLELNRFKKTIGAITFGLFFPNEKKKLDQKQDIGKQLDLVLVTVPEGKQTATVTFIRTVTDWSVKKATEFVKEGDYPKVVIYNVKVNSTINTTISSALAQGIIFKIY